jgi:DNA-directed RNA polymerase specialized sigma24 family protein
LAELDNIYDQYFQDVYIFALSLSRNEQIAEEITQEIFFKALKNLEQFKGNCKISVWLSNCKKHLFFLCRQTKKIRIGCIT